MDRVTIARAIRSTWGEKTAWDDLDPRRQQPWLEMADSVLAARNDEMEKPSRLVEDWRWVLLKSASVKFSALVASAFGFALYNFDLVFLTLSQAPPEVRGFVPLGVFILLTAVSIGLRIWKQDRK